MPVSNRTMPSPAATAQALQCGTPGHGSGSRSRHTPACPFEAVETTVQDDRAAVRWRATGTFAGAPFNGIEATGARIELEGVDVLVVRGGRLVENNAFPDGMGLARQLGLMPPPESPL